MGKRRHQFARGLMVTALTFVLTLAALYLGLTQIGNKSDGAQIEALENAARRAAVLCYAVEGRYPNNAAELCEKYGLTYDHDRYIVTLNGFASNLLPDIRILTIGGEAE